MCTRRRRTYTTGRTSAALVCAPASCPFTAPALTGVSGCTPSDPLNFCPLPPTTPSAYQLTPVACTPPRGERPCVHRPRRPAGFPLSPPLLKNNSIPSSLLVSVFFSRVGDHSFPVLSVMSYRCEHELTSGLPHTRPRTRSLQRRTRPDRALGCRLLVQASERN